MAEDSGEYMAYHSSKSTKRTDYLSWDEYFMSIALLSAQRSKDPNTQVGAAIVNEENRIVGTGYNGMPRGCHDDEMPWSRDNANPLDNKYLYVCHAEMNAILNSNTGDVRKCRMFTAQFPCNECAKVILQSGIAEVIYLENKYSDSASCVAAKRMFEMAGVKLRHLVSSKKEVIIDWDVASNA